MLDDATIFNKIITEPNHMVPRYLNTVKLTHTHHIPLDKLYIIDESIKKLDLYYL